jgi:lipopolysaccharide export LptBFGC system permease protein LptF
MPEPSTGESLTEPEPAIAAAVRLTDPHALRAFYIRGFIEGEELKSDRNQKPSRVFPQPKRRKLTNRWPTGVRGAGFPSYPATFAAHNEIKTRPHRTPHGLCLCLHRRGSVVRSPLAMILFIISLIIAAKSKNLLWCGFAGTFLYVLAFGQSADVAAAAISCVLTIWIPIGIVALFRLATRKEKEEQ